MNPYILYSWLLMIAILFIALVYFSIQDLRKLAKWQKQKQELFNKIFTAQNQKQLSEYKNEAYRLISMNLKKQYIEGATTHNLLGALVERGETLSMELRMNIINELNSLQRKLDDAVSKTGNKPQVYAQYDTIKLLEKLLNDDTKTN